jgi:hypothetical protein
MRLWPFAISLGLRNLFLLNNINRWIPAAGILAVVLLAKPRHIPWRKRLFLLVPVSLAATFILAAYRFRGSVEKSGSHDAALGNPLALRPVCEARMLADFEK